VLQLLDLFAGLLQPLQHQPCGFQVDPADFGQQDPPRAALEQSRTEFRLQVIDRFGQGRRGLAQLLGRATETAELRGDHEHFQCTQLVHAFSIQAKTFFVRKAFCRPVSATNLAIRRNNKEIFNEKIHPEPVGGAISFASMEAMAATDLVLVNGKIFTADRAQPKVQALAVENGKVLKVGTNAQIKALIEPGTQVIDLGGKTLMPGLIDSHSHAIFGGLEMVSANMEDEVVALDELQKRLRAWRDDGKAKHGDVLSIAGMSSAYWAQAEALGKTFNQGEWADVPVVFTGSDHHTAWANNVMLKRAGIDAALLKTLPAAEKDTIGTLANGEPNGFLVDAGWDRVAAKCRCRARPICSAQPNPPCASTTASASPRGWTPPPTPHRARPCSRSNPPRKPSACCRPTKRCRQAAT
jgi:hypothetical protein